MLARSRSSQVVVRASLPRRCFGPLCLYNKPGTINEDYKVCALTVNKKPDISRMPNIRCNGSKRRYHDMCFAFTNGAFKPAFTYPRDKVRFQLQDSAVDSRCFSHHDNAEGPWRGRGRKRRR